MSKLTADVIDIPNPTNLAQADRLLVLFPREQSLIAQASDLGFRAFVSESRELRDAGRDFLHGRFIGYKIPYSREGAEYIRAHESELMPRMIAYLDESSPQTASSALYVLEQMESVSAEGVAAIVRCALEAEDGRALNARFVAQRLHLDSQHMVDPLLVALQGGDETVRVKALTQLGRLWLAGDDVVRPHVLKCLRDDSQQVACAAAKAINEGFHEERHDRAIWDAIAHEARVRSGGRACFVSSISTRYAGHLFNDVAMWLSDSDSEVRVAACEWMANRSMAWNLTSHDWSTAVTALRVNSVDANKAVAVAARAALRQIESTISPQERGVSEQGN